jgi:hypothetical protein
MGRLAHGGGDGGWAANPEGFLELGRKSLNARLDTEGLLAKGGEETAGFLRFHAQELHGGDDDSQRPIHVVPHSRELLIQLRDLLRSQRHGLIGNYRLYGKNHCIFIGYTHGKSKLTGAGSHPDCADGRFRIFYDFSDFGN